MVDFISALTAVHAWSATVLSLVALAAYVALDLAKRARLTRQRVAVHWLIGAALALGTGVWSAHVVSLSRLQLPFPIGYHPGAVLTSWLLGVAASMACLLLAAGRGRSMLQVGAAGAGLGLSVAVIEAAVIDSVGLRPGVDWAWGEVLWPLGSAMVGSALALVLFFVVRPRTRHRDWLWQLPSAALFGASVFISQQGLMNTARIAEQSFSAFDRRLTADALTALATVGSFALLAMMLLCSVLEARIRARLARATRELTERTAVDPLTQLPTRGAFEAALIAETARADAAGAQLALLVIDPGGINLVNDTYGHQIGDQLLHEIADRLRTFVRPQDRVARLGGDEFLILLAGNPREKDAARLSSQLLESLSRPCTLGGRDLSITCAIGVAMYPEHGAASTLVAHAESAVRAAKATGGATYCFFEPRMLAGARDQRELLHDLRLALNLGQLELYYQPKIDAPSGEITGVEALLRWHHPQRGMVSPVVFIPMAERFGLINALGNWVIHEACRQARAWRDEGLRMRVAINLSAHQLRQPDLADRIGDALVLHQINPKLLTCEITESVAMDDDDATLKVFDKLEQLGVHISIDDFGTGYSSLAYLRKLPAEELKIDRSFVLDLETSSDARAVVDAVVKLAQALGLKVVAEGVETEGQNQILRALGCDQLQGFLFAKPMSAKALFLWAMRDEGPRELGFRNSLFKETLPNAL